MTNPKKSSGPRQPARKPRPRTGKNAKTPRAEPPSGIGAWLRAHRGAALWAVGTMLATAGIAVAVLLLVYGRWRGAEGAWVDVEWPQGLDERRAGEKLAEAGLTDNPAAMTLFLRATGGTAGFAPGPHVVPRGATPWELRRYLSRSILRPNAKITIPEGFNRFDIGARLEKNHVASKRSFVAASSDAPALAELGVSGESAEGYLFPATYSFPLDTDPREIVARLVAESDRRWAVLAEANKPGLAALKASLGWGRREVVALASIVEKEAAVDDERPIIASVFLNRLTDPGFTPKRLQSDPTASYGCVAWPNEAPSCASFTGKPTPAINRDAKNRYSTYARNGLPPGPIANPGARSLEAVLNPMPTHFLYFVAAGHGRHTFSETLDAHNDAVRASGPGRGRAP